MSKITRINDKKTVVALIMLIMANGFAFAQSAFEKG
jgi:hypothetical protein